MIYKSLLQCLIPFSNDRRVFSAFIKEVDGKTNADTIWGKKSSFGSCLKEFSNGRGIEITDIEITSPQMVPLGNVF